MQRNACLIALLSSVACSQPVARPPPSTPVEPNGTKGSQVATSPDPRVARVTSSLLGVVRIRGAAAEPKALDERLRHTNTAGASVAVAEAGQLAWARGFGLALAGSHDLVDSTTLFQAGSISKVLSATAALALVESGQLDLDRDVNAYLKAWKVPDTDLTAAHKVTLRRILSHRSGICNCAVGSYREGDAVPSLLQILEGKPPATSEPLRVDSVPGSVTRYSGKAIAVEQLLLTEQTGRAFPALLDTLVFQPLAMSHSTFEQPLPRRLRARASAAHDSRGNIIGGKDSVIPEMAAAGLWSTPSDLLRWAIDIAEAYQRGSGRVLSQAMAESMLTSDPDAESLGLGPVVEGQGRGLHFGHAGWNPGFHAEVVYFPETRQGAAVMVNGDGGRPLVRELLYAIAAEYHWPDFAPPTLDPIPVEPALRASLLGNYEVERPEHVSARITAERGRLYLLAPRLGTKTEIVFTAPHDFVALDSGDRFSVQTDDQGRATALQYGPYEIRRQAPGSSRSSARR